MIRVDYNGLVADVREEHLAQALDELRGMNRAEGKAFMASVKRALDASLKIVTAGKPLSEEQMQDTANDICLWFAHETLAGRAERYRAAVQ